MDKMNNCGELELNNSNELRGKRIVISLEEYYRLLNDNSILTAVKNLLNEMSLEEAIGNFRERNRDEALTRYEEQNNRKLKERMRNGQN